VTETPAKRRLLYVSGHQRRTGMCWLQIASRRIPAFVWLV
jgi:hypothetical protein